MTAQEIAQIIKRELQEEYTLLEESGHYWEMPEKIAELCDSVFEGTKLCFVCPHDGKDFRTYLTWAQMMENRHNGISTWVQDPEVQVGETVTYTNTDGEAYTYRVCQTNYATITLVMLSPEVGHMRKAPITEIYRLSDNTLVWRI